VAVRTHVSRDLFRYEHLNRERTPLERLRPGVLAAFDLIVADGAALAALAPAERAALRSAVADSGRGLLVRPDAAVLDAARRRSLARDGLFPFAPTRQAGAGTRDGTRDVRPQWPGRAGAPPAVPAAAWTLPARFGVVALATDADGRPLAQLAPLGAGRVATTLVTEPGRWLLLGDRAAYADYWTRLLDALAGGVVGRARWTIAGAGPLPVHEPVRLRLTTGESSPAAVVTGPGGADTVHLASDPYEPGERHALYWPRRAGWHSVEGGGAALDFLVSGEAAWPSWRATERTAGTLRLAARPGAVRSAAGDPSAATSVAADLRPLPEWWGYLVFLGAMTTLWVAGRRRG
jgi:hypothetical protein